MKLKKIIFLIPALILCAVFPAYAFTDIADTDGYAESVQRLSDFGIINGFSDGSFRPDETLTRTQFAKIAVCMLDKEDAAKSNSVVTPFFDVDQFYWGVPYINYVSRNSIIKGYGDGSFHPESAITYAETVTVLLRTLGYNEENVGYFWPDNYMDQAGSMGLLDGIYRDYNSPITRAEAALLADRILFTDKNGTNDEFIKSLGYELVEDAVIVATSAEDETLKANEIKLGDDSIYEVTGFGGFKAMSYAENLVVDEDKKVVSVQGYFCGDEGIEKIKEQGYNVITDCCLIATSGEDRNLAGDEIRTSKGVYKIKDTSILEHTEEYGVLILNKEKKAIYALTEDIPYKEYIINELFDGGVEYISSDSIVPLELAADFPVYVDYKDKSSFSESADKFISGSELTVYSAGTYSYGVLDTNAGYSIIDDCFIIASNEDDKSLAAGQVRTSGGVYKVKSSNVLSQTGSLGKAVIDNENKIEQFIPTQLDAVSVVANKLTDNTLEYIMSDGSKASFRFDNTFVTYLDYNKNTFAATKGEITPGTDITFYGERGNWDFAVIDTAKEITPVRALRNYSGNEDNIEGIPIKPEGLTVYRAGLASALSEIRKDDVLYYNPKTNILDVYTDKVTGIYSDAKPNKAYVEAVTVGGSEYTVDTTAVSALDASGGSFEIGERVTLLLGRDNKAVFAVELADSALYDYGVLLDTYTNIKSGINDKGRSEITAKLFMPDGNILEYAADKDYKDYKGDLMKIDFENNVVSLKKVTNSKLTGEIDKSGRKIGSKNVMKDVSIIQRISDEDADNVETALIDWDTLDVGSLLSGQVITYVPANAFGDIQILYVTDITKLSYEYAMVAGVTENEDSTSYKLIKDGRTETVSFRGRRTVVSGIPAAYKSGGDSEDIFNLYEIAKARSIDAVEGGRIMINNTIYQLSENVVFYSVDISKTSNKYSTLSLSDVQSMKNISRVILYSDANVTSNSSIKAVVIEVAKR